MLSLSKAVLGAVVLMCAVTGCQNKVPQAPTMVATSANEPALQALPDPCQVLEYGAPPRQPAP